MSAASLAISGFTFYLQFWPEYDTTATTLEISVSALDRHVGGAMQVSVELALWNRGHRPAVVSGEYLLFDLCQDLRSAQMVLQDRMTPFVISPGAVVLKTLDANILLSVNSGPSGSTYLFLEPNGKTETEMSLGSQCSTGLQADRKKVYIGVGFEAVQSDGALETSSSLGGLISQDQTTGLDLNDKYGSIGHTALYNMWTGHVPKFIKPFSVVPGKG
jgi:hypothetical protein